MIFPRDVFAHVHGFLDSHASDFAEPLNTDSHWCDGWTSFAARLLDMCGNHGQLFGSSKQAFHC
jgi:hypothetical protein